PLGRHAAHAGAGVATRAPQASALDDILVGLGVRTILRPLEVFKTLPTRLSAAKGRPVELDIQPLGCEEAFLHRDEIVETHALGRDFDSFRGRSHAIYSRSCWLRTVYHNPACAREPHEIANLAPHGCPRLSERLSNFIKLRNRLLWNGTKLMSVAGHHSRFRA